ncbi:MAG: AAA family ATPase [Lentisphaeria bacterium]|nr:AAA family ATPase [Lentisphaeria bacterium]
MALILYLVGLTSVVILVSLAIYAANLYRSALDLNPIKETRDSLKHQIAEAQRTLTETETKVNGLHEEYAKARHAIQKAEEARLFLQENSNKVSELKAQIERAKEDFRTANDQKEKRQEELNVLIQEVRAVGEKLESSRTELAALVAQKSSLDENCKHLQQQGEALKQHLAILNKDLNEKSAQVSQLEAQLRGLQEQCNSQKAQCSRDEARHQRLQAEYESLSKKKDDLENEITRKKAESSTLEVQLAEEQAKADTKGIRWEDLKRPWQSKELPNVSVSVLGKESTWLEELGNNLKDHGLLFSERTLRAFHTSLKVMDISPLVILAGVSGTGKSLLPRLYAHALGMNFLQVAIQPRWDSPQDMLGFYNYMERRFKATELSRLLWQYDIYNNDEAKKKYSKSGVPMNLVLLDEMNLAKVEYYFSDFLSKLEVRRGIDPKDGKKRRAAEIEIECGAQASNVPPIYLFPNYNTFFVGTMNEDESTQTLSDKVMDRANVLRFGRPAKLDLKPDIQGFLAKYQEANNCLPNSKTSIWPPSDTPFQNIQDALLNVMDPINECLAKVGRPFAHRVWQAMESYVSNYPIHSEEGQRNAIADQLEMKILPKLNGLEKERPEVREALKAIQGEMDKLKDEELSQVFTDAQKDESIFFQWHGVRR